MRARASSVSAPRLSSAQHGPPAPPMYAGVGMRRRTGGPCLAHPNRSSRLHTAGKAAMVSVLRPSRGGDFMKVGVAFPQYEIPVDAGAIREYAQGVERLGYGHIMVIDHVLGANTASRPGWNPPYTLDTIFHA